MPGIPVGKQWVYIRCVVKKASDCIFQKAKLRLFSSDLFGIGLGLCCVMYMSLIGTSFCDANKHQFGFWRTFYLGAVLIPDWWQ